MSEQRPRKYEESVRVLFFRTRQRSSTIRHKKGIILTTMGENKFTLLEVLGAEDAHFEVGETIDVSKENRSKIESVLGKLDYTRIPQGAKDEVPGMVQSIVADNEARFVAYINRAEPLTPRTHALEIIPGIGKNLLKMLVEERKKTEFTSFEDIEERTGFKDPGAKIAQRIIEEVTGQTRMNIFAKR